MRFLLAIIALLTGFTAADAARPLDAASPTSAAAQIEPSEAFASAVVLCAVIQSDRKSGSTAISRHARLDAMHVVEKIATTPVSRADCARE